MIRLALVVACIAACSGLEPLTPACGNGVVEPGEDCDSGATCQACSLVCSEVACPDGYTCGADQLCHAPGGRFRGETVIPFEEQGFGITDINQDHYGDIVALGGTSLTAYYGDATASLTNQLAMITPPLLAQPAVAKLDPGDTLDIVLPTLDGLLAYTSPFQVPSPYPFPIDVSMGGFGPRALYVFPLDGPYLGLLADDRHGGLEILIVDGTIKNSAISTSGMTPVCAGLNPASLDPTRHDLYATSASFLYAITGGDGSVCELELKAALPAGAYAVTSRVLPGIAAAPNTAAVFAHLELASECPSLVVTTPSGIAEAPGTGAPGTCKTLVDHALPNLMAVPLAHVPLGAGVPDALATYAGVFEIDGTGTITAVLYTPTRPIDTYVTVDINGDGALDVIASSHAFDDLDVLVRYGTGASGGFLAQSIDTLAVPLNVVTGDFDGDGVGDVTYSEKLPTSERLMIVFGGHDDLHPPRLISTYKNIVETNSIGLAASSDPTGTRVRDLIVLDRPDPDAEPLLLTVLFGSPQRTLLPFFDPRPTPTGSLGFRGAVAGVFGSTPGDFKDLFAVEETSASGSGTYVYLIEPDALGAMKVTGSKTGGAIQNCSSNTAPSGLCIDGSVFATYRPTATATTDLVVAFDTEAQYHVAVIDPSQLASGEFSPHVISLAALGLVTAPGLLPHQLFVADLDGDGANELVAGFAPAQTDDLGTGAIISCHPTVDAITCEALEIPGWSCGPAAPANVVRHEAFGSPPARVSQDLVAACVATGKTGGPELVHLWWNGSGFEAEAMFPLPASTRYLETGDVTGDGVDDVLVFDRDRTSPVPLLHVYPQCTSRDADSCRPLDGEAP